MSATDPETRQRIAAQLAEPFVDHARTAAHATQPRNPACRICGHVHDPEDGRCDVHAHVGIGACPCPGEGFLATYDALAEECRNRAAWAEQYMAERDKAKAENEDLHRQLGDEREAKAYLELDLDGLRGQLREARQEVERLRKLVVRALAALGTEGATNYERRQAAGLILNRAATPEATDARP